MSKKSPEACKFASQKGIICHKTRLFGKFPPTCVRTLRPRTHEQKSPEACKFASQNGMICQKTRLFVKFSPLCVRGLAQFQSLEIRRFDTSALHKIGRILRLQNYERVSREVGANPRNTWPRGDGITKGPTDPFFGASKSVVRHFRAA